MKQTFVFILCALLLSQNGYGFAKKKSDGEAIWIAKSDGSMSCEPKSGKSVDDGAQELKGAKVQVLESKKVNDGKVRIQMCGTPTGNYNLYSIKREDLSQATALGFEEAGELAKAKTI